MDTFSVDNNSSFSHHWSIGKMLGVGFAASVVVGLLVFAGFFFYYFSVVWGGGEQSAALAGKFNKKDSTLSAVAGSSARSVFGREIEKWENMVRPHMAWYGEARAPITVLLFVDMECPYCKKAHEPFFKMINTFSPMVRVGFKHFPVEQLHREARMAGKAAQCAAAQGKFFDMYSAFMENTEALNDEYILSIARSKGITMPAFSACLASEKIDVMLDADVEDGLRIGVRGTPTYVVNGKMYEGVLSEEEWRRIMVSAIAEIKK